MKISKKKIPGFSLTEVLISLAIIGIVSGLSIYFFTSQNHLQIMKKSGNQIANALKIAQVEAMTRRRLVGVCFKKDSSTQIWRIVDYLPVLNALGKPTDENCTETSVEPNVSSTLYLKKDILICESCDAKVADQKSLFFNRLGGVVNHLNVPSSFEICMIHGSGPSGSRTREIEVSSNGKIELLANGQAGELSGVQANAGTCQ